LPSSGVDNKRVPGISAERLKSGISFVRMAINKKRERVICAMVMLEAQVGFIKMLVEDFASRAE
jgi:hypothetical protein